MAINWKIVTPAHVREACRKLDSGLADCQHPARNTFLLLNGRKYSAKCVRGLAYEIATGRRLDPSRDFSGGEETARFFRSLGFSAERTHSGTSVENDSARSLGKLTSDATTSNQIEGGPFDPVQQKQALQGLLMHAFGSARTNQPFDWLAVPEESATDPVIAKIHRVLAQHRGNTNFARPGTRLRCDFYLPAQGVIVEYDERQHFTEPRAISLQAYPDDIKIGFDKSVWVEECHRVRAHDNDPIYRDEQRAFYDSIRDILAARKGLVLVRIKHGDLDWNSPESEVRIQDLVAKAVESNASLGTKQLDWHVSVRSGDKGARLGRILIVGAWQGDVESARKVLEKVAETWPENSAVDFLVTCGAFLRFPWPDDLTGDITFLDPPPCVVERLRREAEEACKALFEGNLAGRLARCAHYLTLGVDSPLKNKITTTKNRIVTPHAEFVCVVNLLSTPPTLSWTGKSYPTNSQQDKLVRITNLESHFFTSDTGVALVLGCHDLSVFNPRGQSKLKPRTWRWNTARQLRQLAKSRAPVIVLHHPHTAVKVRTWRNTWNQLCRELASVKSYIGAARYCEDDAGWPTRDPFNEVLQATKLGPSVDVEVSALA